MAISNINNNESGVSVRNKLNQLIGEINSVVTNAGTTGATLENNIISFDTTSQNDAYNVNISSAGPFASISDYGFIVNPPPTSAITINTNITLNYPTGTTVTYQSPLIIGTNGSVTVPNDITLEITP